jgi:hypothetical protein
MSSAGQQSDVHLRGCQACTTNCEGVAALGGPSAVGGCVQAVPKEVAEQLAHKVPQVFSVGTGKLKGCHLQAKNVRHHEHWIEQVCGLCSR